MLKRILNKLLGRPPGGLSSAGYWETRYRVGGNSGAGSYGHLADFKAEVLNAFVAERSIKSVIEFGCGDGNQLTLAKYPSYIGVDVSSTAVELCRGKFRGDATKRFEVRSGQGTWTPEAELALSLDVIYHLLEDRVFELYMRQLFTSASRYAIVYASNGDPCPGQVPSSHVKHRPFTAWVKANIRGWSAPEVIRNRFPFDCSTQQGSFADFYIYSNLSE